MSVRLASFSLPLSVAGNDVTRSAPALAQNDTHHTVDIRLDRLHHVDVPACSTQCPLQLSPPFTITNIVENVKRGQTDRAWLFWLIYPVGTFTYF